jgi:hypothetical protein
MKVAYSQVACFFLPCTSISDEVVKKKIRPTPIDRMKAKKKQPTCGEE